MPFPLFAADRQFSFLSAAHGGLHSYNPPRCHRVFQSPKSFFVRAAFSLLFRMENIFTRNSTVFLFGNGTRNLIASSWRNKTLRKRRMMKAARKKDPMYSCILFHFLLHILSSLKYTYSECKSLSKLLIHSHPPKSHANLIKKKKERESTQKTSPLSPFSGTQSIIRSRGSFRPRSSTSCTAKVKKKRNSSEIPKERIGNSFLLHIPHPRHLATNLSLSSPSHSSLHLSTDSRFTDDRRTALQKVGTCSPC